MGSRDLMIQKFKITIFLRSKSWDHQISEIKTMGSRLLWALIIKSQKSGSRDHGKINHEIIGSYIYMIWDHGIIHFHDMRSRDHTFSWYWIMGSYIFMILDHGIIDFYNMRSVVHKFVSYEIMGLFLYMIQKISIIKNILVHVCEHRNKSLILRPQLFCLNNIYGSI